jgi:hypothetical protein
MKVLLFLGPTIQSPKVETGKLRLVRHKVFEPDPKWDGGVIFLGCQRRRGISGGILPNFSGAFSHVLS